MNKQTIFGGPGCGKTTDLMQRLMQDFKHTDPSRVAFVSYTKQGTYEGAKRAHKKFGLKNADTPYFRTIHALCFRELGMRKYDMFQLKHYKLFSEKTGIPFTGYYTQDYNSPNDAYLHAISMERHNPALALQMSKSLNDNKYEYIKMNYAAMKKQLGIKDFDDLLEDYLEHCEPFDLDVAYIDEGQDLTPLQWKVVRKMFSNVKDLTVAGDDEQALFTWAGADVRQFLDFSKKQTVLNKSWRLPKKAYDMARRISNDIQVRKIKDFCHNGEEGVVERANDLYNVDLNGGELVLARTNYKLRQLSEELEDQGIYYIRKGFTSARPLTIKGIRAYKDYLAGRTDKKAVTKFGGMFTRVDKNTSWQEALEDDNDKVAYYEKLLNSGWLEKEPVLLETFHSSKGSENKHVIISPDLSSRVQEEFYDDLDSELKCIYVGVSRTEDKITFLAPDWRHHYPMKYFM